MQEQDLPTQLVVRPPSGPAVRLYLKADETADVWVYGEAHKIDCGYRVFVRKPRPLPRKH